MKTLCKYCNNRWKSEGEYFCLGGKKNEIKRFESDAKESKKISYGEKFSEKIRHKY